MKIAYPSLVASAVSLLANIMLQSEAVQVPTLKLYENTNCGGTTVFLAFFPDRNCDDYNLDQCFPQEDYDYSFTVSCADSYKAFTDALFGTSPYLFMELYDDGTQCGTLNSALVYPLDGKCHGMSDTDFGIQGTLNTNNSVTLVQATDGTCSQLDYSTSDIIPSSKINTNVCFEDQLKLYSNVDTGSSTTTNATTGDASIAAPPFGVPIIAILVLAVVQTILTL